MKRVLTVKEDKMIRGKIALLAISLCLVRNSRSYDYR